MPANIQELALAIGFKKQAALQTALVAADCWSLSQTNQNIGQPVLNVEDNAEDIGKGDEWVSATFPSHWDAQWAWDARLSSQNAAMIAVFGLGKVSKAAAGTGFAYTCTPLDPIADGIELPSTTIVQAIRQGASDLFDFALIGMCCEEFRIRLQQGPGRDNATMTSSWIGCGKYANPSTIAVPSATSENLLNCGGATELTIRTVDYLANKRFVNLEAGWKNNIRANSGFYPGSGSQGSANIRGRMRHGRREAFLTFETEFENGSTELTDFLAQTEGTAAFSIEGATIGAGPDKHKIEVDFHRLRFRSAIIGQVDNIVTTRTDCAIMKHSVNGVLTIVVTTTQDDIGTSA